MNRLAAAAPALLLLLPGATARAQQTIDEIKGRIFDAHMAQKLFANGLKFCGQLDGTTFYFAPRNRVLDLADYHRALDDLVKAQAYNPQTRKPWTAHDAEQRWAEVKRQAARDKENCALVASLPELERRLAMPEAGGTPQR